MAHYVIFTNFFKVTWPKNVPAYVKTEGTWQKRNYIRNVLQPTRSLCHFRFKSYGHYLIFTKVVTLTLPFVRLSKKKVLHCRVSRRHLLQKNQDDRTSGAACRAFEDRQTNRQTDKQTQTDRQTDRGDQYTFRKSKISKIMKAAQRAGLLFETTTFFYSAIDIDCNMSRWKVKGWNYSKK